MSYHFKNRRAAGLLLAEELARRVKGQVVRVLALPRGGVPVAFEIAQRLDVPLEIFLVRKLGVPGHEEFAMGAISSGGGLFLKGQTIEDLKIPAAEIDQVIARETQELHRRETAYRQDHALEVAGDVVVVVDDGLATGASMRTAVRALRRQQPRRIIVAVPVAAASACEEMAADADEVVCLYTPVQFHAVGEWYEDFSQTSDEEVLELLSRSKPLEAAGD